jgi:predicted  nucleic acid-binding Zn-ribbon protein
MISEEDNRFLDSLDNDRIEKYGIAKGKATAAMIPADADTEEVFRKVTAISYANLADHRAMAIYDELYDWHDEAVRNEIKAYLESKPSSFDAEKMYVALTKDRNSEEGKAAEALAGDIRDIERKHKELAPQIHQLLHDVSRAADLADAKEDHLAATETVAKQYNAVKGDISQMISKMLSENEKFVPTAKLPQELYSLKKRLEKAKAYGIDGAEEELAELNAALPAIKEKIEKDPKMPHLDKVRMRRLVDYPDDVALVTPDINDITAREEPLSKDTRHWAKIIHEEKQAAQEPSLSRRK